MRQKKKQEWMMIVCIEGQFHKEYSDVRYFTILNDLLLEKRFEACGKTERSNHGPEFDIQFEFKNPEIVADFSFSNYLR